MKEYIANVTFDLVAEVHKEDSNNVLIYMYRYGGRELVLIGKLIRFYGNDDFIAYQFDHHYFLSVPEMLDYIAEEIKEKTIKTLKKGNGS